MSKKTKAIENIEQLIHLYEMGIITKEELRKMIGLKEK